MNHWWSHPRLRFQRLSQLAKSYTDQHSLRIQLPANHTRFQCQGAIVASPGESWKASLHLVTKLMALARCSKYVCSVFRNRQILPNFWIKRTSRINWSYRCSRLQEQIFTLGILWCLALTRSNHNISCSASLVGFNQPYSKYAVQSNTKALSP